MKTGSRPRVGEASPSEAWTILSDQKSARLIDVRTRAEWSFVGVPDLSELGHSVICIEWASFPEMSANPRFVEALTDQLGDEGPGTLLFVCRSGVRSLKAAEAVAEHYAQMGISVDCRNVVEGFEGDLDSDGHRGTQNGWRFRGLAWRQS